MSAWLENIHFWMDVGLLGQAPRRGLLCIWSVQRRSAPATAVVSLPSCCSQQDGILISLCSSVTFVRDAQRLLVFISLWILEAAAVEPCEQHRLAGYGGPLSIEKHPFPTHSLPADLCYPAASPVPGHRKRIHKHTSLHHSKYSRNQAKHTTWCSSALACASQSAPQCDGASSLLPTKYTVLGW